MRIGECLLGSERFRSDDEECRCWVERLQYFSQMGAIHIRNKMRRQMRYSIGFERLGYHHRPEVGTTDADIDNICKVKPGISFQFSAMYCSREMFHLLENTFHLR